MINHALIFSFIQQQILISVSFSTKFKSYVRRGYFVLNTDCFYEDRTLQERINRKEADANIKKKEENNLV